MFVPGVVVGVYTRWCCCWCSCLVLLLMFVSGGVCGVCALWRVFQLIGEYFAVISASLMGKEESWDS